MTVTIELPPDLEAGLLAEARAEGLNVSDYVQCLVRKWVSNKAAGDPVPAHDLPPDEWVRRFNAWTLTHSGNTVVLPDDAMEREAIYGDHGQ